MFKKDDYIVLLKNNTYSEYFPSNYCYKQSRDADCFDVYDDVEGGHNGWSVLSFTKCSGYDWRYATQQEIEEYNRIGKPFNITKIQGINYEIY